MESIKNSNLELRKRQLERRMAKLEKLEQVAEAVEKQTEFKICVRHKDCGDYTAWRELPLDWLDADEIDGILWEYRCNLDTYLHLLRQNIHELEEKIKRQSKTKR